MKNSHTGLAMHDGYIMHSHEIRADHAGVPGLADDCGAGTREQPGNLPLSPEGHCAEAQRLLACADDLLQDDGTPRGLLELAVLAIAHAVTALAADEYATPDSPVAAVRNGEWSAPEPGNGEE